MDEDLRQAIENSMATKAVEEARSSSMTEMEEIELAMAISLCQMDEEVEYRQHLCPTKEVQVPKVSVSDELFFFWLPYGSQEEWKKLTQGDRSKIIIDKLSSAGWTMIVAPGRGRCFPYSVGYYVGVDDTEVRNTLREMYVKGNSDPAITDEDKRNVMNNSHWLGHAEIQLFCKLHRLELVIFDSHSGETKIINPGGGRRVYVVRLDDNHYNIILPPGTSAPAPAPAAAAAAGVAAIAREAEWKKRHPNGGRWS